MRPLSGTPVLFLGIFMFTGFTNSQEVNFTSSNLPIIVIDTHGQEILDEERIAAHMGIIRNPDGMRNAVSDSFNNYNGRIAIELRGSSSQMFEKKQYGFETQDAAGENLNISLLGMPAENDWVLYAPYSDKSLLRNVLSYKLSRDMGRYTSRTRFCELVLNGDYRGLYVLMEKIKRDKNRVAISKLNPDEVSGDDLSGGYIFKLDKFAGEQTDGWQSQYLPYPGSSTNIIYQYHYPKPDDIVLPQKTYIQNVMDAFEDMMFTAGYDDPLNGYPAHIDVPSFVDYFILNEATKNIDGYRLSMFMYKDKNSVDDKLYMGPIWDFNLAFGNANYYDASNTSGWQYLINSNPGFVQAGDIFKSPFWWQKLAEETEFRNRILCRWQELRTGILAVSSINTYIDSVASILEEAQQRNFQRWPILGTWVWPNAVVFQTWEEEVLYLRNWFQTRLLWLDANLPGNCVSALLEESGQIPHRLQLSQNYPNPFNGTTRIYYTLPHSGSLWLQIFDMNGRLIDHYYFAEQQSGKHEFIWSGTDRQGREVASGIYVYSISVPGNRISRRMLLIK